MRGLLSRLTLASLFILVTAAVSIGCGGEVDAPLPVGEPGVGATAPAPEAATLPPTATTAAATAIPTAAPTQAPDAAAGERGNESLVVISSRSVSTPSRLELVGGGGFNRSPMPQTMPTEGGLTVSAVGSVTVAADEVYVVIVPEQNYGPSGPQQMTADDRQDIRDNLAAIGVPEEAIEFEDFGRYGLSSVSVEVELSELAALGEPILDAVEEVVRRSESHGVRYSLSAENCDRALSLARREAVPATEKAGDDLAEALGVERGTVIGALEYPPPNLEYRLPGVDIEPCAGLSGDPYSGPAPFDAEAEVEVSVNLQVTYRIR